MNGETKEKEYAISAYLDDEFPEDISLYLVQELLGQDNYRIGGNVIKANARMGWRPDAYKALERRREYGDVGDHSLLTDGEAEQYLQPMGLKLADGKQLLLKRFKEINGYQPTILPVDPDFTVRRDSAREYLGLPAKP